MDKDRHDAVKLKGVDEISMVSQELLGQMDLSSRKMAVGGTPVYRIPTDASTPHQRQGYHVFESINFCVFLTENMRQRDDPDYTRIGYHVFESINFCVFLTENMRQRDDPDYTRIVRGLRYGHITTSDPDALNSRYIEDVRYIRHLSRLTLQRPVITRQLCVHVMRTEPLSRIGMIFALSPPKEPIYIVRALPYDHSRMKESYYSLPDHITDCIPMTLTFFKGMPVMFTDKIIHKDKIGVRDTVLIPKGSVATIVGVQLNKDDMLTGGMPSDHSEHNVRHLKSLPDFIIVHLRDCNKVLYKGCDPGIIPIRPKHRSVEMKFNAGQNPYITLTQYPSSRSSPARQRSCKDRHLKTASRC
ncbi:hypothetical protein BC829DRAFT_433646 [Chytridium lagenaria]|nr:hypothetical protein BC829DRAFT_433646 [Chytridium lagenaria]